MLRTNIKSGAIALVLLPITGLTGITDVKVPQEYKDWAEQHHTVEIPQNIQTTVNNIQHTVQSDAWQKRHQQYLQSMKKDFGIEESNIAATQMEVKDRVVIFVSESMPMHVLRQYAADLAKIDGIMVLRGMKGGISTIKPTINFISKVLKVDPSCTDEPCKMLSTNIVVDPLMFRNYGIDKVPATVFIPNMNMVGYCENKELNKNPNAHIAYGDANIRWQLKEINKVENSKSIEQFLTRLEKN